jgi:predicted Rossmann-fold nucleotide-binding protein
VADRSEPVAHVLSRLLERRKIGIAGSSKDVTPAMREFSREVGKCLAADGRVCIVTGGTKQRADTAKGDLAVDWHVAEAARVELETRKRDVEEHLATVPRRDASETRGFRLGSIWKARGKTGETRRFAFVRRLDALIAIGGGSGTDQELALAIELGIPVLPVPTFPGRETGGARKYWNAYRKQLVSRLKISAAKAIRWEKPTKTDPRPLARQMTKVFLKSLARRCFVIMPFAEVHEPLYKQVIGPAVKDVGDTPINLKYLGLPGDGARHVVHGIRAADYVIAVLDDLSPNVMYELGLAHAYSKPAVLISCRGAIKAEVVPFDIATQNRLEYNHVGPVLRRQLIKVLKGILIDR